MAATQPTAPKLRAEHCQFGDRYQFESASCQFRLHNEGAEPVVVSHIKPLTPGDSVSAERLEIAPHSTATIDFTTQVGDRLGNLIRFVAFDVGKEPRKLIARGFVVSDLDDAGQAFEFGTFDAAKGSAPKTITLSSHAVADFRITRLIEAPSWANVQIGPDGRSVTAQVKPDAAWSPLEGRIKLAVNTPHQNQAWLGISANPQGLVIASSNPYEIGAVHAGNPIEFIVRVTGRDHKPVELGESTIRGVPGKVKQTACAPKAADCAQLVVTLPKDLPLGIFRGELSVELPAYARTLPVAFGGFVVAKTTIIKNEAPPSAQAAGATAPSSAGEDAAPSINLSRALSNSVEQAKAVAEPPPGSGPLLKWQVANEEQVHGYLVYRADQEGGPFVRVNEQVIGVASNGVGWTYQWRDDSARSGAAYWYYVAVLGADGRIKPLSSPQKVVAK
ncbi:hypothetical protein [Dokdonella sp.]|uniref:hypothetical protein n=1 Tax=Dokdonella sp. TaxID=2291710 RepID=UPI003F81306A